MQHSQKDTLKEELNTIFVGNSVLSYRTEGRLHETGGGVITLSNGEVYLLAAGWEWGATVDLLMSFKLNEVVRGVEIIPFDEEAYKNNPHRSKMQYHRIEFYGDESNLVGVIVTSAFDGLGEEGYLRVVPDVDNFGSDIPEPGQEGFSGFGELIKNTDVVVKCLVEAKDALKVHIQYFVEAPGGSTYTGSVQQNAKGFVGYSTFWDMLGEDNFAFFSTSLEGGLAKDREILSDFAKVVYNW